MKTIRFFALIFILLSALNVSGQSIEDQLAALDQEDQNIQQEYGVLNADIGNYNIVEKQLESEINVVESSRSSLDFRCSAIESERADINSDIAAYDGDCGSRTFYLDQEGEQAAYDDCISIRTDLENRVQAFNASAAAVESEVIAFNEANVLLGQKSERQKVILAELNDREQKLQTRKALLDQEYRQLVNSPAFQQLIIGKGISDECKHLLESNNLDAACHCLQVFWDGAD